MKSRKNNYTAGDAQAIAFCLCLCFTLAVVILKSSLEPSNGMSIAVIKDGQNSIEPERMEKIGQAIDNWNQNARDELLTANFYLRKEQKFIEKEI